MKLVFGLACDGPCYPDFPGDGQGAFGTAVVGPIGLVDAIETQLGLTGPRATKAARTACYVAKMRAALDAEPNMFFSRSAGLDPWATAATLLKWRDDLVTAGWNERPVGAGRVDALARVARSGAPLPPGLADRLAGVRLALVSRPVTDIESIELVEPRDGLPLEWRQLVEGLAECGVAIVEPTDPQQSENGDLGRVQRFLEGGAPERLEGDGSVAFVRSDTALASAEAVAEWLAHGTEEELHGTVVICPEGDTALLDLALRARGLPALGQSAASPWRGALQVLPLVLATAWAPFDAKALLDLLLLPHPPIPRWVARNLANALSREPGTGGDEWSLAWAAVHGELDRQVAAGELDDQAAERRLAGWREWTSGGVHSRAEGMPAAAAKEIAGRVLRWTMESDAGSGDPLLLAAAGAASAFIEAVELIALDVLPALLVDRMVAQVLAEGAQNPDHQATAGGLRCVRHPGAIWSTAPRLIWWDFKGPGDRVQASPWSKAETAALGAAGCKLEALVDYTRRIGRSYGDAVLRAEERIMFVTPALSGAGEATSHPLAHQLEPIIAPARGLVTWSAERLLQDTEHRLLGRDLRREQIPLVEPPCQRSAWSLPEGGRNKLAKHVESATSFERLADCQMRWILVDVLRLSRGRAAEIPGPDQLFGNLAHKLANAVLRPGEPCEPAQVREEVEAAFEQMVAAIATPLQRPEFASELAAACVRIPAALAKLSALLHARGLQVVGTELERARSFPDGLSVAGRLDLVVRHPVHGLGVIDLKWSKSARRRSDEFSQGRALQLATYGAIAEAGGVGGADGAYYLLNQRRLIGLADGFLADETIQGGRGLAETWQALSDTWRTWRDLALGGTLVASGTADAVGHVPVGLPVAPGAQPCEYCELTRLCRVTEEQV